MSATSPQLRATGKLAYLHLLRAIQRAFAGDAPLIYSATQEARSKFIQHRATTSPNVYLQQAADAEHFLLHHVIQARKVDSSGTKYSATLRPEHGQKSQ